jgi:hypothetical protein
MADDHLCLFCATLPFHSLGYHDKPLDDDVLLLPQERPFTSVISCSRTCPFCNLILASITDWAEKRFADPSAIDLQKAVYFDIGFTRFDSLQLLHGQGDSFLVRMSAELNIRGPAPEYLRTGPKIYFQRCDDPVPGVSSFCEEGNAGFLNDSYSDITPFSGRIRPSLVDIRLLRRWRETCNAEHGAACCGVQNVPRVPGLRFVDVEQLCIVEDAGDTEYLALSYVWGPGQPDRLLKSTLDALGLPKSLLRLQLPSTIADAISFTRSLGARYLWVDRLCIIQDDDSDMQRFVPVMDRIYGHSSLTFVAAEGNNADAGLPGIGRSSSSRCTQSILRLKEGITIMTTLDSKDHDVQHRFGILGSSEWDRRAWTFQELLFSGRSLVFTGDQVYWVCQRASWCEDSFWEIHNPTIYRNAWNDTELRYPWPSDEFFMIYTKLVNIYTQRHLSYQGDALAAFSGIVDALERTYSDEFFWGLPVRYLSSALCWPLADWRCLPREATCSLGLANNKIVTVPFPSWSWLSQIGEITYDDESPFTEIAAELEFYRLNEHREIVLLQQALLTDSDHELEGEVQAELRAAWKGTSSKMSVTRQAIFSPDTISLPPIFHTCLFFYTSSCLLTVHPGKLTDEELQKAEQTNMGLISPPEYKLSSKKDDTFIDVEWLLTPVKTFKEPTTIEFIVIARDTRPELEGACQLCIMAISWKDGIARRLALASVYEGDWGDLEDKEWEMTILG